MVAVGLFLHVVVECWSKDGFEQLLFFWHLGLQSIKFSC